MYEKHQQQKSVKIETTLCFLERNKQLLCDFEKYDGVTIEWQNAAETLRMEGAFFRGLFWLSLNLERYFRSVL